MKDTDWDDEGNIERWCMDQREVAANYLASQPAKFGELGEWPAWHVAPYVALWVVESVAKPGLVGWWVICGDLPTDYASGSGAPDPRSAVAVFAQRWQQAAEKMKRGEKPDSYFVGDADKAAELAPLLASRAQLLSEWVQDASIW
jgi:hypothetical protein